ncbi:hypothetical protein C8J56DRAFT_204553 [Mycena floridula]|nr:hypothetical protein C8J56DRAFT_204553 [Mycena floridula]
MKCEKLPVMSLYLISVFCQPLSQTMVTPSFRCSNFLFHRHHVQALQALCTLWHPLPPLQALNVTVESNSTDLTYSTSPGWNQADTCKVDSKGNIVGGQAGCVNIPSNCTNNVSMAISAGASVNLTFFGDAIYFNGLSATVSGVFTVTIDGDSTDVDGYGTLCLQDTVLKHLLSIRYPSRSKECPHSSLDILYFNGGQFRVRHPICSFILGT